MKTSGECLMYGMLLIRWAYATRAKSFRQSRPAVSVGLRWRTFTTKCGANTKFEVECLELDSPLFAALGVVPAAAVVPSERSCRRSGRTVGAVVPSGSAWRAKEA